MPRIGLTPLRLLLGIASAITLFTASPALAQPAAIHPAACQQRVVFGLVDVRTSGSGCFSHVATSPDKWEATGLVTLNGLPIPVLPGTKLTLTGPSGSDPGSLSVDTNLIVAGVKLKTGLLTVRLPQGAPGDAPKDLANFTVSGQSLFGFGVVGTTTIKIGRDSGGSQQGYATTSVLVGLPSVFKSGPLANSGSLTGEAVVRSTASGGVSLDGLKIQLTTAYIGSLPVKHLCLSYQAFLGANQTCAPPKYGAAPFLDCAGNGGGQRWDGTAVVTIPTADKPELGLFAGTINGQLNYAGGQVTSLGKSVPLAPGVYLDKFGLGICMTPAPMKLKGTAAIRFGPEILGHGAAYLDGQLEYVDSSPWVIKATGDLTLFGYNLSHAYLTYRPSGALDFGFDANFDFAGGVFTANGNVKGWYQPGGYTVKICRALFLRVSCGKCGKYFFVKCEDVWVPRAFNVYGEGKVCVADVACAGGEVAVSTKGVAGCFTIANFPYPYVGGDWYDPSSWYYETRYKTLRAGAGYYWDGSLSVMGDSCDVGPYQDAKTEAKDAAGAQHVRIPAGQDAVVLKIGGHNDPPKIRITGPDGRVIVSPKVSGIIRRGQYIIAENPTDSTTEVLIVKPAAGTWKVTTLRGSAPITGIAQADADTPPQFKAGVRNAGAGQERMLGYAYMPERNHKVSFVERGGTYEQQLGPATGSVCKGEPAFARREGWVCGDLDFTPATGPAGVRHIYALTYDEHGDLVREQLIATYRFSGEPKPARPTGLRITRHGQTIMITWNSAAGAVDYDLDLFISDGRKLLDVTGAGTRHVTLHGIPRQLTVRAVLSGLRSDDVPGPAASIRSPGR